MLLAVLIFGVMPVAPECHETREPQLEILGSVIAGTREILRGHPSEDRSVVALLDGELAFCTGTLISPTVVLTAAHCFDQGPRRIEVFFGDDARPAHRHGFSVRAIEVAVHPGWDGHKDDIALVRLAYDAGMPPKPLIAPGSTETLPGQLMRIAGFGIAENGEHGVKLEGTARVSSVSEKTLTHVPEPSATCSGDSGGPGFVIENGREVLAAVHVLGSCGGESTKTRVDAYRDSFIQPFLDRSTPAAPPLIPEPMPEPVVVAQPAPPPTMTPEPDPVPDPAPSVPSLDATTDPTMVYVHAVEYLVRRDTANACPWLRRYLELEPNGKFAGVARTNVHDYCP